MTTTDTMLREEFHKNFPRLIYEEEIAYLRLYKLHKLHAQKLQQLEEFEKEIREDTQANEAIGSDEDLLVAKTISWERKRIRNIIHSHKQNLQ